MYKVILAKQINNAIIPPNNAAAMNPNKTLPVIDATAKPIMAVINKDPSKDKFTIPTRSDIVSPTTANTSGALIEMMAASIISNSTMAIRFTHSIY